MTDIDGLQEALFSIGSGQNIHLARLSRGKKILFLEGDDYRLLRRFASKLGFTDLANDINITVIPIGGFSQRQRIEDAAWTFEKVLKAEIAIAAVLDRDYRCPEEIEELVKCVRGTVPHFHVLGGKEIENYLLVPAAIARAISDRLRDRPCPAGKSGQISGKQVEEILGTLTEEMKLDVSSQIISNRMRYFAKRTSKDPATVAGEAISMLEANWTQMQRRWMAIPGKRLLSALNGYLQHNFHISITTPQILRNIAHDEIEPDLRAILEDINQFARAP